MLNRRPLLPATMLFLVAGFGSPAALAHAGMRPAGPSFHTLSPMLLTSPVSTDPVAQSDTSSSSAASASAKKSCQGTESASGNANCNGKSKGKGKGGGGGTSAGPSTFVVGPSPLPLGAFTLKAQLPTIAAGSTLLVDGVPLTGVTITAGMISGTGYLQPWTTGPVTVQVMAPDKTVTGQASVKVASTAASFDTAARFATQAAFGPRPDVVLHIQQVGLSKFLDEQFQAPVGTYSVAVPPVHSFFLNATTSNSLLRLRTAWAFQTFIPVQAINEIQASVIPWQQTLERDAFTNYRQILLDAASDPDIGTRLTLPGNAASNNPDIHPNQNFGREIMQLFSLGAYMLNDDGTQKLDASGQPILAYTQDDVLAMSRVFTGWNYATPVDPGLTSFGVDYSQTLVANEAQHDTASKTLFGTVIPGGQTAAQDRDAALDALMNHPNTAPYISRLLIQRMVKSDPSPAYVKRITTVFRNNGSGVAGDLKAVIRAILLDSEARAGDTGLQATDGFLQDPVYAQVFLMSVLQISGEDDQPIYLPKALSEPIFDAPTIFSYFRPTNLVGGTTINSPEFALYNNFTLVQRMQLIYAISSMVQPGFNNGFNGWLYDNFKTLPDMLDALDHLLYHGTMPQAERDEITRYCSGISDLHQQLTTAVFLALDSDGYTVSH